MGIEALILAGGNGIRLGLDIPKSMVDIRGKPLIDRAIEPLYRACFNSEKITTVVSRDSNSRCILDHLSTKTKYFHQSEPKGTAHALREYIENNQTLENILVMQSDDCLLLTPEIIHDSTRLHTYSNADVTILLTTQFDNTHHRKSYKIDDDKNIVSIVPVDINHQQRQLYFSGIACFNSKFLREVFPKLSYQSKGEMSLFSLFDYVHSNRINFKGLIIPGMWIGVNTSAQLIQAREFVK